MTRGLHRAYGKLEGRLRCDNCSLVLPKYPGRYPSKCPHCDGEEFEDLQNSPVYSESIDENYRSELVDYYLSNVLGNNGVVPGPNQNLDKKQFRSDDARKIHKTIRQTTDRID